MNTGFGEEALEPNERDQSPETRPQHLRRRKRRSPRPRRQGFDVRELSEDSPDDFEGLDASVAHIANFLSTEPADRHVVTLLMVLVYFWRKMALSNLSVLLEPTLNFSLSFSSRPLTDFLPHQKILWTLDAWTSVSVGNAKIASFLLEMWFSWHSSLWIIQPVLLKNFSRMDDFEMKLPHMFFQPVRMATVDHILQSTSAIKDYPVHCLKIRVASCNLWQSCPPVTNVQAFLLSVARSLF